MEGMGIKFTPVVVRCLLGPLSMFGPMALFGFIASPNSPNRGFNLPPVAHPPPLLTLQRAIYDITMVLKSCSNPAMLAS